MKANGKFRVTLTIFMLLALTVSAQDTESAQDVQDILQVLVETRPETPVTGAPWILTLLIDHGIPDDVTVIAPQFAHFLSLDRIVKTPRITGTQIQTVIEYRFIPNNPGRFLLDSFTVITPDGIAETISQILEIRGSSAEQRPLSPRIAWEGSPRQMAAGERAVLELRVTDWNSSRPPEGFFMPEVPQGAILVSSPLSAEEKDGGLAVRLILVPLETGDFHLPARVLQHDNVTFEIPALNIRVTSSAVAEQPGQNDPQGSPQGSIAVSAAYARFPELDPAAFDKPVVKAWRGQCENIYNTARNMWNNGLRAQALAELRRNERDHPAGALLQPIRREAEESLGLFNAENEIRRQKPLFGLSLFFFFLVIISTFVCYKFLKSIFAKRAALLCAVVFAALGVFCLYRLVDSRSVFSGKNSRSGVANETPVRRTADYDGETLFNFSEGQPVVIMLNSGSWVYVRANNAGGKSGWIPAGAVIFY